VEEEKEEERGRKRVRATEKTVKEKSKRYGIAISTGIEVIICFSLT